MNKVVKQHYDDRIRRCDECGRDILIKHNQVGGFWYLSKWPDPQGQLHSKQVCSQCFTKLSNSK